MSRPHSPPPEPPEPLQGPGDGSAQTAGKAVAAGVVGGLAGAAALIGIITLAARIVGFGRWLVYANAVSSLCVGNAYSAANQVPNVLYEVVAGGALTGAVVPLLAGPLSRAGLGDPSASSGRSGEVDHIVSALLTWMAIVLVPAALVLMALAGPIADALVNDSTCPGGTALAARFLRVFAPQVVLYGFGVVLSGVLTAKHRFLGPALGPLVSSVTVIASYVTFALVVGPGRQVRNDPAHLPAAGEAVLAWGTTVGVAVMTLPLLVPVLRGGVRLRPRLAFPAGVARRARSLAGAGIAALLAQQATVVAVLLLAREAPRARRSTSTNTRRRSICCPTRCSWCRWPPPAFPGCRRMQRAASAPRSARQLPALPERS